MYVDYMKIVDKLDINKGDIILVGSDISRLAVSALKNNQKIDPNCFIDSIIDKIGEEGTLLLPTYNWDFCNGRDFDYKNTISKTGVLTNTALKRSDFIRTKHPIYSFAVWGKDKELLYDMNNKSSFGNDSPFAYMHKNKAKMITIGLPYQSAFTFVHYVEQMELVDYRFEKNFESKYIDEFGKSSIRTYSMYVRNIDRGVKTNINPIGKVLEEKNISKKQVINNVDFYLIDLAKSYETIKNDIDFNEAKKLYILEKRD